MLPNLPTYEEIYREFRWHIPEYFNIGEAICEKFAVKEPERIALIGWNCEGKADNYTYGQMHERSNSLANVFAELGLEAGERIGIVLPQSVSDSTLCHISVTKWCKESGYASGSSERSERCGRLTGDVAAKAVELLNQHAAGTFTPVFALPEETEQCRTCHSKGKDFEKGQFTRGKENCVDCHGEPH